MSAPRRTSKPPGPAVTRTGDLPRRIAWYALLATAVLIPLVNALLPARLVGLYTLTDDPYHTPKLLVLTLLMLVAAGSWAWDVWTRREGLRVGPVSWALGALAALVVVSTLASPDRATSFFGATSLMTGALTWLLSLVAGVLVAHYATSRARLVQISRTFALAGGVVAFVAMLGAVGLDPLGTRMSEGFTWMVFQGMSTTGNPNYTAVLLVVPLVVSFALAIAENDARFRWAAAASAVLCAAAIFNTLTRAAWLGAAVGVLALVLTVPGWRERFGKRIGIAGVVLTFAALVSVLILSPTVVANRFTSLVTGLGGGLTSGRAALWSDGLAVATAHPLTGSGADRLGVAAYPFQTDVEFEGSSRLIMQDPHSLPLLAAAIFGIPAALALVAALALALKAGFSRVRAGSGDAATLTLYAGWFAGLLGLVVTALFSVMTLTGIYALFLALGVVIAPTLKRADTRAWPSLVGAVVAIAIITTGLWGVWRTARASNEFMQARLGDTPMHLEEGLRLAPWDSRLAVQYLSLKINATRLALTGEDAATARDAAAELDAEISGRRLDWPDELLFHRLRIEVYRMSIGFAGYQPEAHLAAVDDALAAFPNDAEFLALRQEALDAAR